MAAFHDVSLVAGCGVMRRDFAGSQMNAR
jgi:hypothetical protein